jgi:integrase
MTSKTVRISLTTVHALAPGDENFDTAVRGFWARRRKGPSVSYGVTYRTTEGRQRRYTIGPHGSPWTPDTARAEALRILAEKVRGNDPAAVKKATRHAQTILDLCDLYWSDAEKGRLLTRSRRPKKPSTLLSDKGRIDNHIRPLLGSIKIQAVTAADVERFLQDVAEGKTLHRTKTGRKRGLSNVRGGRGVASRTVGLLGGIFSYAVRKGLRPDNPVRGVIRPADKRKNRRLSDEEYHSLGVGLRKAADEGLWPAAIAAARLLTVTGWRLSEALALTWRNVDLARRTATLADTKAGESIRPLSHASCDVLRGMNLQGGLVFPATRGDGQMTGFPSFWERICKLGGLPADITPHVLRHSFACLASDLGYSDTAIGALLGHATHTVTGRYIHSADAVLLVAADAVADKTAELMGDAKPHSVAQFPRGTVASW